MIKKISMILAALLLLSYIVAAIAFAAPRVSPEDSCKGVAVEIADVSDRQYISTEEVNAIIARSGLNPKDKPLSQVNTSAMEEQLLKNRIVRRADCFKTVDGSVKIKIWQRIPFMRVFPSDGSSYYLDSDREIIPLTGIYPANVPVVSGWIGDKFARGELFDFVQFITNDKFWNAQISQIFVAQNGDVELTPTVGNHRIILGTLANYREKLDKLQLFYNKALNRIGWNKYTVINLKFKNQVVCK